MRMRSEDDDNPALHRLVGWHRAAAAEDAALLAHLIADGRVASGIAVTCRDRLDGAGAQAFGVIAAMVLARFAGCRYVHSPFTVVDHAVGERREWAQRWERFFNLGDGELPAPDDAELVRISAFVRDPAAYAGRNIVIAERLFELPAGPAAPIREALRDELRAKYWRGPKGAIPLHRAATGFTAAIHLRRGDVSATRNSRSYVPGDHVLRQVARLRKALAPFGWPLTINLYSEGSPEEFQAFADIGCNLHVSEDAFESFHNMVTADILMTAPSSFSHLAALLSRGIILHSSEKSTRLSNHLRRRRNGDIPIGRLQRALLGRMGRVERHKRRARRWWYWIARSIRR
jgi:hypothetical protein